MPNLFENFNKKRSKNIYLCYKAFDAIVLSSEADNRKLCILYNVNILLQLCVLFGVLFLNFQEKNAYPRVTEQALEKLLIFLACLHDHNKSSFFGGSAFSSLSELFDYFLNCSDWLDKSRPSKKRHFCFDHANRLFAEYSIRFDLLPILGLLMKLCIF